MIVVNPRYHGVKNAIFRVPFGIFSTLVCVTFFWFRLGEIQLWNHIGLEKLDFIKCPYFFDTTNQSRDISTDPNKRFGL